MPPFDAAYAAPPHATVAAIDATFTMDPPPPATIVGTAARVHT